MVKQVEAIVPPDSDVVFLGDGEFDGTLLQHTLDSYGWSYVCRTAKNTQLLEDGDWFSFKEIAVQPGNCIGLEQVRFTEKAYGPVLAIAWWAVDYKQPIYLVSNLDLVGEACYWYARRFRIETFFSDQKSRGFHLHKSHIADPSRLTRLMIAACLAYIWIIYLGAIAKQQGWLSIIHRRHRCDLSLFQLGLILLEHFLDEQLPIPVAFEMPIRV